MSWTGGRVRWTKCRPRSTSQNARRRCWNCSAGGDAEGANNEIDDVLSTYTQTGSRTARPGICASSGTLVGSAAPMSIG